VVKRETNSWKWMWIMVAYMTALAYLASLVTYQTAVALGAG
jgi:ferrous iron transport protein B